MDTDEMADMLKIKVVFAKAVSATTGKYLMWLDGFDGSPRRASRLRLSIGWR